MDKEKEEDGSSVECSECLKSTLVTRPRIAVWSALEASKHKLSKNLQRKETAQKNNNSGYLKYVIIGVLTCLLGISTLIWKPYDLLMTERLEMRKGLPPFEWWKDPPDEVLLSVYIFNITNHEEFISGKHEKLKLQEVGPIVYREKLIHSDIEFHENNTMSYTATRRAIYLPELNTIDIDSTIIVPNLAVLGISSFLWNASFALKIGFNMIVSNTGSKPIVPVSIRNYLWNMTDPAVRTARTIVPHLVPKENFGVLHQFYDGPLKEYSERMNVHIGQMNGRQFFQVDMYNGRPGFGLWNNASCDSVQGSSEGVGYQQGMRKNDVILYLRKSFCRVAPLYYTGESEMSGMNVYKYELSNETYQRPSEGEDCYLSEGLPSLPSGLSDVSPCYHNFPIATSFPHFMNSDPAVFEKLEGLEPVYSKHYSYVYVEPNSGVPLTAAARSQSNLVIRPIKSGFTKFKRFFNMSIPMFWAEYKQVGLPWKIKALTYFSIIIVANYQIYFSIFLIALSSLFFYISHKRKTDNTLDKNAQIIYSSLPGLNNDKDLSS